jgi:hypothetical protein
MRKRAAELEALIEHGVRAFFIASTANLSAAETTDVLRRAHARWPRRWTRWKRPSSSPSTRMRARAGSFEAPEIPPRSDGPAPTLEYLLDVAADAPTRIFSIDSSHQQIVVVGVAVARGRDHCERDRLGVKRTAGGCAPHPAAASLRSVRRDLLSSLARTFGEEARDLACELALEFDVFARSPFRCALALTRPCVLVPQALGLGLLDRGDLDEHALAFIPPAGAAEANDDSRQPTVLPGTARQCRVSGGQEDEMCKISARHAHGSAILHHQQALICASATSADPAFQRRDDHEIR